MPLTVAEVDTAEVVEVSTLAVVEAATLRRRRVMGTTEEPRAEAPPPEAAEAGPEATEDSGRGTCAAEEQDHSPSKMEREGKSQRTPIMAKVRKAAVAAVVVAEVSADSAVLDVASEAASEVLVVDPSAADSVADAADPAELREAETGEDSVAAGEASEEAGEAPWRSTEPERAALENIDYAKHISDKSCVELLLRTLKKDRFKTYFLSTKDFSLQPRSFPLKNK